MREGKKKEKKESIFTKIYLFLLLIRETGVCATKKKVRRNERENHTEFVCLYVCVKKRERKIRKGFLKDCGVA